MIREHGRERDDREGRTRWVKEAKPDVRGGTVGREGRKASEVGGR